MKMHKIYNLNLSSNQITELIVTLFVIVQIQFLHETGSYETRWSKEILVFVPFILSLSIFCYRIFVKNKSADIRSLIFLIIIMMTSLVSIIANNDYAIDNFIFLLVVLEGFFISNSFEFSDYLKGYVNALLIYSIYSLIATYVILPIVIRTGLTTFTIYRNIIGTPFLDMVFSYSLYYFGFLRNQGIFREPGVFQVFILFAIAFELFFNNRKNKAYILIILFVTLGSTFSIIGYYAVIPLIFAFIISRWDIIKHKKLRKGNLYLLILLFYLVIFILNSRDVNINITRAYDKISNVNSDSFQVRFGSIVNLIRMAFRNIIFGNSFVNGFNYIQHNFITYGSNDITGTFFSYIMALGIPVGTYICMVFFSFCRKVGSNIIIGLLIFISLFISINSQNLVFNSVIWACIFMNFKKVKRDKIHV